MNRIFDYLQPILLADKVTMALRSGNIYKQGSFMESHSVCPDNIVILKSQLKIILIVDGVPNLIDTSCIEEHLIKFI